MKLLQIIKNNLFIQNLVSRLVSLIPLYLELGIVKYQAVKKAMVVTAVDKTYGDYLEFGVMTGNSFNFAMLVSKKLNKLFGEMDCEFIGFESFQGFGEIKEDDEHPFYNDDNFSVSEEKVIRNIEKNSKGQKFRIIKGFFKDTIENKTTLDFKIDKARVIMIDCDLKEPARLALEFVRPSIQEGTVIIFDDYNYYKGNRNKGEYAAFKEFKEKYPEISFRRIFDCGYNGRAFIACNID
jgi:O-methyltransferase